MAVHTRQGADQHQQRRLGQVEVGQQGVDHLEAVARADEQPRLPAVRCQVPGGGPSDLRTLVVPTATPSTTLPVMSTASTVASPTSSPHCASGAGQVLLAHRRKGTGTDVRGHGRIPHPSGQPLGIAWSKCSPAGGRGDRAWALRR